MLLDDVDILFLPFPRLPADHAIIFLYIFLPSLQLAALILKSCQ